MAATRCAIVDLDTGNVINAIEYEEVPDGCPPGLESLGGNLVAIPDLFAGPGDIYKDGVFSSGAAPKVLTGPSDEAKTREAYLRAQYEKNWKRP